MVVSVVRYWMSAYTDLVKSLKELNLKELNKVQFLDLSNQFLTEIPPEVFQLTNLKKLCLSYNQIEVIPSAISQLSNLTELHLFGNQDAGTRWI